MSEHESLRLLPSFDYQKTIMSLAPKEAYERITDTSIAWESLRPAKDFANLTLAQYHALIAPSLTARATVSRLESELAVAQRQREEADKISVAAQQLVVNAIKDDPQETENGVLYKTIGYIRRSSLHHVSNPVSTSISTP